MTVSPSSGSRRPAASPAETAAAIRQGDRRAQAHRLHVACHEIQAKARTVDPRRAPSAKVVQLLLDLMSLHFQ